MIGQYSALLIKSVAIAVLAAIMAWLPSAAVATVDIDGGLFSDTAARLLGVALLGSFAVGLPIAMMTYFLAAKQLSASLISVMLAANFAGVVLLLVTGILGNLFGMFVFGVPSVIAANVYALLGWLWILKPMRDAQHV